MHHPAVSESGKSVLAPRTLRERAQDALSALPQYAALALGIHAPFSRRACWFCGCGLPDLVFIKGGRTAYFSAVEAEIRLVAQTLGGRGRPVRIAFGAGSPIQPAPGEIARLLDVIEEEVGLTDDVELAIELDPDCTFEPDIRTLINLGFSRISLCVLDGAEAARTSSSSLELLEGAMSAIRSAEIRDAGITIARGALSEAETRRAALAVAASLGPDRIAVVRALGPAAEPSAGAEPLLSRQEEEGICALGYRKIAPGSFVRPDVALLPAAGAPLDCAEIGFGIGAISALKGVAFENERSVGEYMTAVKRGELPIAGE